MQIYSNKGCLRNQTFTNTNTIFNAITTLLGWAIWSVYVWICFRVSSYNTIGKQVLGIRLIKVDGSRPPLKTQIGHYTIGYFLNSLCLLGWLWPLWDDSKQTWGQKVFGTFTVYGTWGKDLPPNPVR